MGRRQKNSKKTELLSEDPAEIGRDSQRRPGRRRGGRFELEHEDSVQDAAPVLEEDLDDDLPLELPGDWAEVRLQVPGTGETGARQALGYLAYELHDLVAKESIRSQTWAVIAPPRGRPRRGRALTAAERQARYRERHARAR